MKAHLSLAASLLVVFAAPRVVHAQAGVDAVRIEVKVDTDTDREKKGGSGKGASSAATVSQGKTLQIGISGKPKNPETRTGTWTVYGRPAGKGNDLETIDSGDFTLDLPANGQQKIETKKVESKYTTASNEKGSRNKPGKRVDATGTKYTGWSVIVKDGDKVVGEAYDPMGLKAEINKK